MVLIQILMYRILSPIQQTNDQQANEQQSNDSQTNDQQTNDDQTNNQQDENQSGNAGLGKIFFVGDSRTVDMFDGKTSEIYARRDINTVFQ